MVDATIGGRNIQTLSGTTPSLPKFNVNVAWGAVAPMDEWNQTLNITFANASARWNIEIWGPGGLNKVCAGFEYFVHLASRSLMF